MGWANHTQPGVYGQTYVCPYVHMDECMYVCMYTHTCMSADVYDLANVCTHVHVSVCVCVCVRVCVCLALPRSCQIQIAVRNITRCTCVQIVLWLVSCVANVFPSQPPSLHPPASES